MQYRRTTWGTICKHIHLFERFFFFRTKITWHSSRFIKLFRNFSTVNNHRFSESACKFAFEEFITLRCIQFHHTTWTRDAQFRNFNRLHCHTYIVSSKFKFIHWNCYVMNCSKKFSHNFGFGVSNVMVTLKRIKIRSSRIE